MTGKHPSRVGATNFFTGTREGRFLPAEMTDHMPLEEQTIAETLKLAGYSTFFSGKWHLGPTEEYWPEAQGFDVNRGGWSAGGPYGGDKYFSPYGNPRLTDGPPGEHLPDRLAGEAAAFIEAHRRDPFFVYVAFYSVHTPLMAPADLVARYESKSMALGLDESSLFEEEEQVWPEPEPRKVRAKQNHAVYAAMVTSMDRAVGKVLDKLEELALVDSTVVFLVSDNGGLSTSEGSPTSNYPLRGGKGWLYEGGIRVPLLVRWPGHSAPGSLCDTPVVTMDFYPTILQMAGQPLLPLQHLDGHSLVPLVEGLSSFADRSLYWHYPHYSNQGGFPGGSIRAGQWKLIERFEDGKAQLFNLKEDIGEQHDRAGQQPDQFQRLRNELHAWYRQVDARFLRTRENGSEPWEPQDPD